jgi:NitT/TauT family transport system ATP-binding protein
MAGMIAPPPIEVRQLRKVFRQTASGEPVVAIDRLDLDIAPREVVAIVGQTGCGKSTLFDLMIGHERPTAGSISTSRRARWWRSSARPDAENPPCST